MRVARIRAAIVAFCLAAALATAAEAQQQPARIFHVTAAASLPGPVSGRLLLFMKQGAGDTSVDIEEFRPADTWVAAQEVHDLAPGASVEVDADTIAYPKAFRDAPNGTWEMQAVLDTGHTYNYGGRVPADWESAVVTLPAMDNTGATECEHRIGPSPGRRSADVLGRSSHGAAGGCGEVRGRERGAVAVLGKADVCAGVGNFASGLRQRREESVSNSVLDAWVRREPGALAQRGHGHSTADGSKGDAADDLGDAR